MDADEAAQDESTRRQFLLAGSTIAAAATLAGCTGGGDGGSTPEPESPTATTAPTETSTEIDDETDTESGETTGHAVSMPPVGTVEFDGVPETWVANNGSWADMGVALGQDPPAGLYLTSRYHTQYYDDVPGVSVDTSDMTALWEGELDVESFLAIGQEADVFVMDPNFVVNRSANLEQEDVETIESAGTPFFGNSIFSRGYTWHDYDYLTLYQAFEKLAALFDERERYEAFVEVHDAFQENVAEVVPPEDERPSVAIMWPQSIDEPTSFSPYLVDEGTSYKQWRDLGVRDALAATDVRNFHANRDRIDYEVLLEVDPDVILLRGNEDKTAQEFQDTTVSFMASHEVGGSLTAVQNGDVYRGGPLYQGPITNLVQTERATRQVYGVEADLFDRERVGEIVQGDL